MFAEDTNISTQGKTGTEIQDRLNMDLENVHQWQISNKLTFNKKKTEYMIVGSQQRISNCCRAIGTSHDMQQGLRIETK